MASVLSTCLSALPKVDPKKLGCIGHSSGPRRFFLAAFDERVKATVFSEGGIGLAMSNWEAASYLGPQVKAPGFNHDHEELLALIAPRAFLLIGGDSADTDCGLDYVRAAQPVYDLAGAGIGCDSSTTGKGIAIHRKRGRKRKLLEGGLGKSDDRLRRRR